MTVDTIQVLKADAGMVLKKVTEGGEAIITPSVMLAFGERAEDWTEVPAEAAEE